MKKAEIKVGGLYLAKVSSVVVTVRVERIWADDTKDRDVTRYDVTNLLTGRKLTFRSAAKFRGPAPEQVEAERKQAVLAAPPPFVMKTVPNVGIDRMVTARDANHAAFDAAVERNIEETEQVVVPGAQEGEQRPDPTMLSATATPPCEHGTTPSSEAPCSPSSPASAPTTSRPSSPAAAGVSLAGQIVASRAVRVVGAPVAGMVPNDEQEAILATAVLPGLKVLVIGAGAGTGKTATLKMLEQVLPGRGQYTAFNSALVAESKGKFKKAACNTTHSLAFRAVGKQYQHRLGGERMRSFEVARRLGIEDYTVLLKGMGKSEPCGGCTGPKCERCGGMGTVPTDREKPLKAGYLAGQVMVAIRRFCQSADREIDTSHFGYIDGIDVPASDGKRGRANNDTVRDYLLPFARKMWLDLARVDGSLPGFNHDCYVKIWQLGQGDDRPVIAADYVLLDEAQDTAPVFLDVLKRQERTMLCFVGDDCQQIYEWRGACNAMKAYPDAARRLLSQSYRFGQSVADVANTILAELDDPTDLVMRGNPEIPSRVAEVDRPRCYLYRTNAGAVSRVMLAIADGLRPHLIGGGDEVVKWCAAAIDLQARPPRKTQHPELACFDNWAEVVDYSGSDEGSDLKLMVKLVEEFGAEEIHAALKDMPDEEDADLVASTAHKSKGREWDTVRLGPDFPTINKMSDADRRLLYVAATRAKHTLDISECPPFCGGDDFDTGDWVPGLRITYTQTMPTQIEQDAWLVSKDTAARAKAAAVIQATKPSPFIDPVAPPTNGNVAYTWTNSDGAWCVRGPSNAPLGTRVKVSRKDGSVSTVTIRSVVGRNGYDGTWVYGL